MRVLVTGGAGFIGSNLIRLLIEQGHEAVVLDDFSSGYRANLEPFPQVVVIEGDVRDGRLVREAIQGVKVVFHMAASVGNKRSIDHPLSDSEVNLLGTINVLEAARIAGTHKVVFSSSAGIFGELRDLPIKENHPTDPESPYGTSKLAAEKMCLAYGKLYGLQVVCLRYFNVYGANQRYDAYGNVIPIFAHRMLNGLPVAIFGDGGQTRDFVNVKDVAKANYQAAMASSAHGVFNIASGTAISINSLFDVMSAAVGSHCTKDYRPPRPGDVRDSIADITAARQAFAYVPQVKLEEGLTEYIHWARREMV
jgi:UDP-glucose 4-epimerase